MLLLDGWKDFQVHADEAARCSPLERPLISACPDHGSDGVCALPWLLRKEHVNVQVADDLSHGVQRDVVGVIKKSKLWTHELLMLLCWNTRHGPFMSKTRAEQVAQCMQDFFAFMEPGECDLFQSLLRPMLRDRGLEFKLSEPDIIASEWQRLQSLDGVQHNIGETASLNRFMGMLREGRREDVRWHSRLFYSLVTCMQEGLFQGGAFDSYMKIVKTVKPAPGQDGTGATAVETTEESVMRRAANNALVVSTLMLADPTNQAKQRAILTVLLPTEEWHSSQNRELRSTSASLAFTMKQVKGGFWDHLFPSVEQLVSPDKLRYTGFSIGAHSWSVAAEFEDHMENDDELATHLGDLVLATLGCRLRRCLWLLRGWDSRSPWGLNTYCPSSLVHLRFQRKFACPCIFVARIASPTQPGVWLD